MALELEDGSGKPNAQSYVGAAEARAYAAARGVTLPPGDPEVEAMLLRAADYLEAQRALYQGHKTFPAVPQALQFPRTDVVIDCTYELPASGAGSIPAILKSAQMQLVIEQQNGIPLFPSTDGRIKKKTKVDVIETEYFSAVELGLSGYPVSQMPAVEALLSPLFNACGSGQFLTTVRV